MIVQLNFGQFSNIAVHLSIKIWARHCLLEQEMATYSSILAWKITLMEEASRLQSESEAGRLQSLWHGVTKSWTELATEHTLTASLLVCMIGTICHKNFFKDSSVLIVIKVNQYLQKLNAKDLIINIKCLHLKKKQQSLKIAYYIQKVFL